MKNWRIIGLCCLIGVLTLARVALALDADINSRTPNPETHAFTGQTGKKVGLEEMREWLNQRNMNRKQQGTGLPGTFSSIKKYSAAPKPQKPRAVDNPGHPRQDLLSDKEATRKLIHEMLASQTGQGPDGRIRHRLIINEEGQDQLQVYTGTGYAPHNLTEDDISKLARLTQRGRDTWMAGTHSRAPASYYPLKPKGWNHPKYGIDR